MSCVNVIYSIDSRVGDTVRCIDSLRAQYGKSVSIALATYGPVPRQTRVADLAMREGFEYVRIVPHTFLSEHDLQEWHSCELLVRIQATRYFALMGYDEIYTMHSDAVISGDFRKHFRVVADRFPDFTFIAPLMRSDTPWGQIRGSAWDVLLGPSRVRMGDIICQYSADAVNRLYERHQDAEGIWRAELKTLPLFSDCAQIDFAMRGGYSVGYDNQSDDNLIYGTVRHLSREMNAGGAMDRDDRSREILTRNRAERCANE